MNNLKKLNNTNMLGLIEKVEDRNLEYVGELSYHVAYMIHGELDSVEYIEPVKMDSLNELIEDATWDNENIDGYIVSCRPHLEGIGISYQYKIRCSREIEEGNIEHITALINITEVNEYTEIIEELKKESPEVVILEQIKKNKGVYILEKKSRAGNIIKYLRGGMESKQVEKNDKIDTYKDCEKLLIEILEKKYFSSVLVKNKQKKALRMLFNQHLQYGGKFLKTSKI